MVSDSMFHRISNALNSYFGLPVMKVLNVSIRPFDNFVPIDNQPYALFLVSRNTTGLLPVGWFIQNPILLTQVARYN